MELVFIPFMSRSLFAQYVGVSQPVVERWIRDGRVSTFKIGKRSLVDLRQWISSQSKANA